MTDIIRICDVSVTIFFALFNNILNGQHSKQSKNKLIVCITDFLSLHSENTQR